MFVLNDDGVNDDVVGAFARYRAYIHQNRALLPRGVIELVTSDWYFNFHDHRCPHDARLLSATVENDPYNHGTTGRNAIIKLFGAYDDLILTLRYFDVGRFDLAMPGDQHLYDYHRDEFLVGPNGRCLHTIEWCHTSRGPTWIIEARDVSFSTEPVDEAGD